MHGRGERKIRCYMDNLDGRAELDRKVSGHDKRLIGVFGKIGAKAYLREKWSHVLIPFIYLLDFDNPYRRSASRFKYRGRYAANQQLLYQTRAPAAEHYGRTPEFGSFGMDDFGHVTGLDCEQKQYRFRPEAPDHQLFPGLDKAALHDFLILLFPEISREVRPAGMHMFDPLDLLHSQFVGRRGCKDVQNLEFAVLSPFEDPNHVVDNFFAVRLTVERDKEAFHESPFKFL
jgi:hypothetical protein